jgi:hypothetical protein
LHQSPCIGEWASIHDQGAKTDMRKLIRPLVAGALLSLSTSAQSSSPDSSCAAGGVQQLRIYEIFERNKSAFHARFRDHATRIMKRHGFSIITMWETKHGDRTEFVYLLQWPDEAVMKERWAAFMGDVEWSRIKRETAAVHGQLVGEIEERTLRRTDYSLC